MDYRKIYNEAYVINNFKHLSESRRRFNERIEPFSIELLKLQMEQFPDIKELLTSPAEDLAPEYKNLVPNNVLNNNPQKTLLDFIYETIAMKWNCLFSMENSKEKINGFIGYKKSGPYVDEIKMFSFDIRHSLPLLRDLNHLIEDFKEKFISIHWSAKKVNNIGNKIYRTTVKKYGGILFTKKDDPEVIEYFIPGTMPLISPIREMADEDYTK